MWFQRVPARKFGVAQPKTQTVWKTLQAFEPQLPDFFCSCRSDQTQQANVRKIFEALRMAVGDRNIHLMLDETYWHPTHELTPIGIIGGPWSGDDACDCSLLPPSRAGSLSSEDASRMSLSFALARTDNASRTWDVCMVPMKPGHGHCKAAFVLSLLGQLLENFCAANGDQPPISISYDNGLSNAAIAAAMLGMLPGKDLGMTPWFRFCTYSKPKFPMWPFRVLSFSCIGNRWCFCIVVLTTPAAYQ